jgi:hypothetical protein
MIAQIIDLLILQEMVMAKAEPKVIPAVAAWDVAGMMLLLLLLLTVS